MGETMSDLLSAVTRGDLSRYSCFRIPTFKKVLFSFKDFPFYSVFTIVFISDSKYRMYRTYKNIQECTLYIYALIKIIKVE